MACAAQSPEDRKDWSDWGWQDWSSMGWDYNYRGGGGGRYDDSHDYGKPKKPGALRNHVPSISMTILRSCRVAELQPA